MELTERPLVLAAGCESPTLTCRTTVLEFPESAAYVPTPPPAPIRAPAATAAVRVRREERRVCMTPWKRLGLRGC
jgi:hypothetical protein